jgi:hypothetical protein
LTTLYTGKYANSPKLNDIQVQLTCTHKKTSLTFVEAQRNGEDFQFLGISFHESYCEIQSQEGISVATMNKKAHHVLRPLSQEHNVRYQAVLPKVKLKETLDTPARPMHIAPTNRTIPISVLVFGPRSVSEHLAKALSRHRLFLQHPYVIPTQELYENPQYPRSITTSFLNGMILPPIALSATQGDKEIETSAGGADPDPEDLIAMINNLPDHDYLNKDTDIDARVTAVLLP